MEHQDRFEFCKELVKGFCNECPEYHRLTIVHMLLQSEYGSMFASFTDEQISQLLDMTTRQFTDTNKQLNRKLKALSLRQRETDTKAIKLYIEELFSTSITTQTGEYS